MDKDEKSPLPYFVPEFNEDSPAICQIATVSNLADSDKLYGLSKFWSEAANNFVYFDHAKINWDSAYRLYIPRLMTT